VQRSSNLVDSQVAAGHTVGNHTQTHSTLSGIGREAFFREILATQEAIGDRGTMCLRPPYGATDAYTRAYAAELGYKIVMWDIDTVDWSRPGASAIESEVLENVFPGAVVLFHDGGGERSQTVQALDTVLGKLRGQGYEFLPFCKR
jgi:peptidoglycan-N-acetylglucosamine deacetylase